jgi:uncharacterized protein
MMAGLLSPVFEPLPIRHIKPRGWLLRQLRIQAQGLSGHLDEFWPDIRDSRWFGGKAEGWERAPYWLDGFIPLAFLLEDKGLIARAKKYMEFIFAHQHEDGWLGPVDTDPKTGRSSVPANYDLWAELLIFKVLVEYHRATDEPRVLDVLKKALKGFDRLIDTRPLFNWGQFRWFEGLIAIYYLYDRQPEEWLLDLAIKIQAQGFHWGEFFQRWPLKEATPLGRWSYMSHVVNNAMAIKSHGLWKRISRADADHIAVRDMIAKLDQYHGMVTGVFSGDECLAGRSPTQGTELCAVNEYAYSLECLISLLGEAVWGDRLESIIYNALPATFSPDMWTHQYDQQVNQVECSRHENRTWNTNGPESNLFGLEPNYGCCTANLSQGWPKFASHLWMRSADGGLAAVAYAPCKLEIEVKGIQASAEVVTEYPFNDSILMRVVVEEPVVFPLYLRIPAWTQNAEVLIGDEQIAASPGEILRIEREWHGETLIKIVFPMPVRLIQGYRGAGTVVRGPLIYSLHIREEWRRVNAEQPGRELPHADFEVYALTNWNYGLHLRGNHLEDSVKIIQGSVGELPFSPQGAPIKAIVQGRKISGWGIKNGSADEIPLSPVQSDMALEELTLIPYGCTNLRISEFPLLAD